MMAIAFDLERLQQQIAPFSFDTPAEASDAVAVYYRFYGLDFEHHASGLRHHFGHFSSGKHEIVCHYFARDGAVGTCFLFHGYFDHAGLFRHAIDYALARGFNVVIYDLPGHGLSTGERASINSFAEYEQVLRDALALFTDSAPHPWHAIAQSTGAAVVLDYLLLQSVPTFDKAVLLAPLVRAAEWRWVKTAHWLGHRFLDRVPRRYSVNSSDPAFLAVLRNDPLQAQHVAVRWVDAMVRWERRVEQLPESERTILVIQGEQDTTVDWRYNIPVIRGKFPKARYLPLKGAHHHLVNEAPAIRAKIWAAIDIYFGSAR